MNEYDYLVDISGWSGPSYLAARPLTYDGNGYDDLLLGIGSVFRSVDPTRLNSCEIRVSNHLVNGQRFSDYLRGSVANRIENKQVTVRRWFRDEGTAVTIFVGQVRSRSISELEVALEVTELRPVEGPICRTVIDSDTWPNARQTDVGRVVPVNFNTVPDVDIPITVDAPFSRLSTEIDSSSTADLELDSVEGFPSSGTIRIGREKIAYTGVNTSLKTLTGISRAQSSTVAAAHIQGSLVLVLATFEAAIDAQSSTATISKVVAIDGDNERFPLSQPNSHAVANSTRVARWSNPPTYFYPKGEAEAVGIEFDGDGGSTATNPGNARAKDAGYTESNYSTVSLATINEAHISTHVKELADRGRIKKVLITVNHSGTNPKLGTDLGSVEVLAAPISQPSRVSVGFLSETDDLDSDFLELAEQRGRRPVDLAQESQTVTGAIVQPTSVAENGLILNAGTLAGSNADNARDGDNATVLNVGVRGGSAGAEYLFYISAVPGTLPASATIDEIRFKCRHGSASENSTQSATITLFESGSPVAGPGSFSPSTSEVEETATFTPTGKTISDLTLYVGRIQMNGNTGIGFQWDVQECWFEVDYTDNTPEGSTGSTVNQFDATAELGSWERLSSCVIDIRHRSGLGEWRLYHVGVQVIYEPLEEKLPTKLYAEIAGSITGDPATLIFQIWTLYGGMSIGSINLLDITDASTRLAAEGFSATTFAFSLATREDVWVTIQSIAAQSRLAVYFEGGQLRLQYLELAASITTNYQALSRSDIQAPQLASADLENDLVNQVSIEYDESAIDGFKATLNDEDTTNQAQFGKRVADLQLPALRSSAVAQKIADYMLDRQSIPWEVLEFAVSMEQRSLELLDVLSVDFGWIDFSKVQIEEIEEQNDHTFKVRGRELS